MISDTGNFRPEKINQNKFQYPAATAPCLWSSDKTIERMKKTILFTAIILPFFLQTSCIKDNSCQPKTVQSEEATMQSIISANGMTATRHSSGMYYEIINPGSGAAPDNFSSVSVRYVGKLKDGTVFDQTTTPTALFPVSNFIAGWQIGLPLIREGGSMKMVIPSSLAYGCRQAEIIPANSVLYFEVELVDVQ